MGWITTRAPSTGSSGRRLGRATSAFEGDRCLLADGVIGTQTLTELKSVVSAVQTAAGTTPGGDHAAVTTAAVKTYQAAHGLEADGIAGPDTMSAMGIQRQVASCHTPSALGGLVVSIVSAEIGTRADSNECVPGKPYSICAEWCAAFAAAAGSPVAPDVLLSSRRSGRRSRLRRRRRRVDRVQHTDRSALTDQPPRHVTDLESHPVFRRCSVSGA